jgi:hypothetical protein
MTHAQTRRQGLQEVERLKGRTVMTVLTFAPVRRSGRENQHKLGYRSVHLLNKEIVGMRNLTPKVLSAHRLDQPHP